ncbi:hypothetical protein ACFV2U_40950 [Streptomyces sp. NPDC059697]|uniref:hypothetical protein n=1 Tax=Streptomyces sp. NPDC059697 TaxID=3346912 RepID=UPI0036741278
MNQENSSRVAVIAGTGADMDIPNRVIGSGRTGRAQARRIKVIVCHRVTSVSVSTSDAHTSRGARRPPSGQPCSTGARSLLISRFHAFCAPSPDAAERPTGPT